MELRHLRYFVAVAEELHFGRAAARLLMAQPPLSQQIRQLEDELGVALFARTRRRVELTQAGEVFLAEARLVLAAADQAVRSVRRAGRGEIGRLAVGFTGSAIYGVLPLIFRVYRERFPDVNLVLQELPTADQVQALHAGRIQAGFLRLPLADDTLRIETILHEPIIVALPASHPLAAAAVVPLAALRAEPLVLIPRHVSPGLHDQILSACRGAGFSPHVRQEANQMQTIVGLVAAGLGLSLVPAAVQNLQTPGVVYRPLDTPGPRLDLGLAWRHDDPSPVLAGFVTLVREITHRT